MEDGHALTQPPSVTPVVFKEALKRSNEVHMCNGVSVKRNIFLPGLINHGMQVFYVISIN